MAPNHNIDQDGKKMMMEEISQYEGHISVDSKCDSEFEVEETDHPPSPSPEKPLTCQVQPSMRGQFVQ